MNRAAIDSIANLCADHLRREEKLLADTLPVVRAVKAAFATRGFDALAETVARHQDFMQRIDDLKLRRTGLREQLGGLLELAPRQVTLGHALDRLPAAVGDPLKAVAKRVRAMVDELVVLNHWIAVHLHIYLGAWHGLLRGVTGTEPGSGRYGPAGTPDANDYRPILQLRG